MLFSRFAILVIGIYHVFSSILQFVFPEYARYNLLLGITGFYIDYRVLITILLLLYFSFLQKKRRVKWPIYPLVKIKVYLICFCLTTIGYIFGSDELRMHCQMYIFYLSLVVHVGYSKQNLMTNKLLIILVCSLLLFGNRFFVLTHGLLFLTLNPKMKFNFKNSALLFVLAMSVFIVSISREVYGGRMTFFDLFTEESKPEDIILENSITEILLSDFVYRIDGNSPLREFEKFNSGYNSIDFSSLKFSFMKAVPALFYEKGQINQLDEEDFYNVKINISGEYVDMTYGLVNAMIFSFGSFYLPTVFVILLIIAGFFFIVRSPVVLGLIDLLLLCVLSTFELNFTGLFLFCLRFGFLLYITIFIFGNYNYGKKVE